VRRLPNYFLAYEPHGEAPDVSPAPVSHRGYITFGSFNALAKLNAGVLSVWADILNNVKGSRLLLKADGLGDSGVRQRVMQAFVERGVESERIVMERRSSDWVDYAAAYSQIDVALDPFPFNGGTTSMDGLWMGVPMVSLRGDRCVSRFGAGILRCLGLDDLSASTPAEYVETAVHLALNTERITTLRSGMRERMLNSALCDCVTFTRALEDLYRTMWRDWCQSIDDAELQVVQIAVQTRVVDQFVMRSLLDDSTLVEDQDAIRTPDSCEAMGDDEGCPIRVLDSRAAACRSRSERGVERRCRLVQNQDARIPQQRPRNGQPLSLSFGQCAPRSPICVSRPSCRCSMNSTACAARAAARISASLEPGRPSVMLSRTEPANRNVSWNTIPIWLRSHGQAELADIDVVQ